MKQERPHALPPKGAESTWGGPALTQEQRKANVRLALILATIALALALGFVAKFAWFVR